VSNQLRSNPGKGALIVTLLSFAASVGCMLGLIFAIPRFVNSQGDRKALMILLIWGGAAIVFVVIFCIGLMHFLRARRSISH